MSTNYPNGKPQKILSEVEKTISYVFKDKNLLRLAFTHSSVKVQSHNNNERLELIGDSVIGIVVIKYLYKNFPIVSEGEIVKVKSFLVGKKVLYMLAQKASLHRFLLLDWRAELFSTRKSEAVVSSCFESLVGAMYVDSDYDLAAPEIFILNLLKQHMEEILKHEEIYDYKSYLQIQSLNINGMPPEYKAEITGPIQKRVFRIRTFVNGKEYGEGTAKNKKEAENLAAKATCEQLKFDIKNYYLSMIKL